MSALWASILPLPAPLEGFGPVSGQIQYGSVRPLTAHPTLFVRRPPTTNSQRFPSTRTATKPLLLLLAASLLLSALLMAAPREIAALALVVVLCGIWLTLVLAMTLPRSSERAGWELVRRLAQFRHEINTIGDTPSRAALARLTERPQELGLQEDEVTEELNQLRACIDALDLQERLALGGLPSADAPDVLPAGDACHFACPVRFGRRRADQFGHLVISTHWLRFRGALDVSVTWSEVASVRRARREIIIGLRDSRRVLRFSCHSHAEAACGGVIAQHLAETARADTTPEPPRFHASV